MKVQKLLWVCCAIFTVQLAIGQQNVPAKADYFGKVSSLEYVSPMSERSSDLLPADTSDKEAKDKRSFAPMLKESNDPQTEDDYFFKNPHEAEQSVRMAPASLVFDAYASGSQPTDPSLAVGPNHVMVVFNTGFAIYDKSGNQLQPPTAPNPAIFPNGGCCDLTVSYDNAADRWVLSFLGNGAQIAVSDGPNPLTAGWYVYTISAISDYQKLSVWSDGYYITENTVSANKVWALERDAMLNGDPNAQIIAYSLPGLVTSGFHSPQALNVTNANLPAAGGATIVYMQDDAWNGVSNDHIKLWTIDTNWNSPGSSTISAAQEFPTTPFIGVFDNGSFSNLRQPGGGRPIRIDALQATIMNQAQFRKFGTHNSAVFNFVVDVDASSEKRAGVRWYEFRQNGDNQPWSLYQEGTYTAPDGRHAWNASLAMDGQGNIGMGYTSMSGPSTSSTVQVSSYFTGRGSGDPLGTMTAMEGLIANGNAKIPGTRYGDYSKIDVDPSDDSTFWFINEYMNGSRRGVVGVFQMQAGPPDTEAPTTPGNLSANAITSNSATLNWTASTDNVGVTAYNVFIDGNQVGTTTNTSFDVTGLTELTTYAAAVTAEDGAGNTSSSATTSFTTLEGGGTGGPGVIAAYYFESGLQGWTEGGNDAQRQASSNSFEGAYSIKLRDGSSTSNAFSPAIDLSGNTQVTVEFHTYTTKMDNGEGYVVEFSSGGAYQVIGSYSVGTDFSNDTFFTDTITLSSASYTFNANNRFRIRCLGSSNKDQMWFDQVIVSGDNTENTASTNNQQVLLDYTQAVNDGVRMYPNPAEDVLNVEIIEGNFDSVQVFSTMGQVIFEASAVTNSLRVDTSQFASGTYFVRFISNGLAVTKRFVKK